MKLCTNLYNKACVAHYMKVCNWMVNQTNEVDNCSIGLSAIQTDLSNVDNRVDRKCNGADNV